MDLASFKEDLVCALGRPEEWRFDDEFRYLIHASTGIRVSSHGQTYRSGVTAAPYHQICNAPRQAVYRCRSAVSARDAEARSKNEARDRQAFLDSFPGFQS